jgi:hypothetical protein
MTDREFVTLVDKLKNDEPFTDKDEKLLRYCVEEGFLELTEDEDNSCE